MSDFFKNKYKLFAVLASFILVITASLGIYAKINGAVKLPSTSEGESSGEEEESEEDLSQEEEEPDTMPEPVEYNIPGNMRAAFLTPGVEFMQSEGDSSEEIKNQIAKAIETAKSYTLNTIIINTNVEDKVLYALPGAPRVETDFDVLDYIVKLCRNENLYVYTTFDVSHYSNGKETFAMNLGGGSMNELLTMVGEFAEHYSVDGILLDGYQNEKTEESYSLYSKLGGAIGFQNYMRQTPEAQLRTATKAIRENAPNTQVGILVDAVWANVSQEEEGSQTAATYTSLSDGNADTKKFVQDGLVDFVMVKAYGSLTDQAEPFSHVVDWWVDVAKEADTLLYISQAASRVGSGNPGWNGGDQLLKQVVELDETVGVFGNAFDSLAKLSADPAGSTSTLMKYYKEEIEPELILTQLEMTKPTQTTYSTNEKQVTFTGASDPNEPVEINGETIKTDQSGYFTKTYELKAGVNEFTISHKDKTISYKITRQINILTEMGPTKPITTDGGMEIRITAVAYDGATVTANVGGSTVNLTVDDDVVAEDSRDSSYKQYTGVYRAPAATGSVQNIGSISVTASWNGETKTLQGASITVNKKAKIEDGVPVTIVADQAKTYPANTLDNITRADCYPLPKGAMDYAVGEEIEYKGVSYTVLASGLRVLSSDIQASNDYASGNTVDAISIDTKDGFTYITLKTTQKVSYNFSYAASGVSIKLNNTTAVPPDKTLSKNPLFTSATWSGSTLNLSFIKQNGFMGYKGYYDNAGNLVFRFNNTPSSIGGARIVIDPGHGGKDTGALGFLSDYPEKAINMAIAQALAEELQSRGATVLLLDTSGGMDLASRVARAENFNADLFVSVHNNTAPNASAKGTEVYYFYPFSQALASSASANVSNQLSTSNRGAKQSYYNVTLSSQFPSVLVECGFMSNKEEYEKLIRPKYQEGIASGIADGISGAIATAYTGVNSSGSENAGGSLAVEGNPEESSENSEVSVDQTVAGITLNRSSLTLREGKTSTVRATVTPSSANQKVTWSSSNDAVATVNSEGKITGVKTGSVVITATSAAGKSATCSVTVSKNDSSSSDIPVEEVVISTKVATIEVGKTYQLDVAVYPSDATNSKVSWSSSDTSIATVDAKGLVTAHKDGKVDIVVESQDGEADATCTVTVITAGQSNALDKAKEIYIVGANTSMYIGSSQTLRVETDTDKPVSNSQLIWKSSDKSLARVEDGVITARRNEGTVTISAQDKSGNLYDSVRITITKQRVNITSVSLNKDSIIVEKGTPYKDLKVTVTPSDATNTELTWSSVNTKVATVDQNGVVTGQGKGTTTIIVKTKKGDKQATCRVEVTDKIQIEEMELDSDEFEMREGATDRLEVSFYPTDIPNKKVTWRSSQPSVVSVDADGNLTALKPGKATITATYTADSSFRATCTITVVA